MFKSVVWPLKLMQMVSLFEKLSKIALSGEKKTRKYEIEHMMTIS